MTLIKYIILIFTGLSTTLSTYLDRLIIYPLLGGDAVTVYTVASFFGKSLGIVMTPIAGVLLGYYAQRNFIMTKKKFWSINVTSSFQIPFAICVNGYISTEFPMTAQP